MQSLNCFDFQEVSCIIIEAKGFVISFVTYFAFRADKDCNKLHKHRNDLSDGRLDIYG